MRTIILLWWLIHAIVIKSSRLRIYKWYVCYNQRKGEEKKACIRRGAILRWVNYRLCHKLWNFISECLIVMFYKVYIATNGDGSKNREYRSNGKEGLEISENFKAVKEYSHTSPGPLSINLNSFGEPVRFNTAFPNYPTSLLHFPEKFSPSIVPFLFSPLFPSLYFLFFWKHLRACSFTQIRTSPSIGMRVLSSSVTCNVPPAI